MEKQNKGSAERKDQGDPHGKGKTAYTPPKLVKYGSVAMITGSDTSCAVIDMDRVTGKMLDRRTGLCPVP